MISRREALPRGDRSLWNRFPSALFSGILDMDMDLSRTDEPGLQGRIHQAIAGRPLDAVARAAGLDRNTLRSLLRNTHKRGPYLDTLVRLAQALEVEPAWLAFGRQD